MPPESSVTTRSGDGLRILANCAADCAAILDPDALRFVERLVREFGPRRAELLERRRARRQRLDAGERPAFLETTRAIREAEWTVAPHPADLADRRVEITGPVERKMIINALNSGANVFMADFEDSHSPTWENCVRGQRNLYDAVRRTIEFTNAAGKHYALRDETAVLMVRPRGWHLDERHVALDGRPVPASLIDFGLFFFHNARELVARGTGPYFYLPKLENHLEARLWNDVFVFAQEALGLPRGSIRATVLIETILAAFEMDEILWELREHSAGLNCGRWDYIFSIIKSFCADPAFVLPDRAQVTMTTHAMRSYARLAIATCHRRGAHAIGGMAAQIPIRDDPAANEEALARVRADKEREAADGHDGTWVAHPGLVALARDVFDAYLQGPNRVHERPLRPEIGAADLLAVPAGTITEAGLRHNIDVCIRYMEAWLSGNGCVPIYNLMEDAATAEISRSQVWQWVHHDNAVLDDGRPVTATLVQRLFEEQMDRFRAQLGPEAIARGRWELARRLLEDLVRRDELVPFMTSVAYAHLD